MEYIDYSLENLFKKHYAALSLRLQEYEYSFEDKSLYILITGDKYYDFGVAIKNKDSNNPNWFISPEYNSEIKDLTQKLFSIVKLYDYRRLTGIDIIRDFASFNSECKVPNLWVQIPSIKVRLKNINNDFFYEHLPNIYFQNDDFYVSNLFSNYEKVGYAGYYLGVRDHINERVYEGDIILARTKDSKGIFWGLAFDFNEKIALFHSTNSLPSYLSWAKEFEIVGNFFENCNEKAVRSSYINKYDWKQFQNICENRAKELGWMD